MYQIEGRPSDDEWDLIEAIESGRPYWPLSPEGAEKDAPLATISAELIRAILLGRPIERRPGRHQQRGDHLVVHMLSFGIRIGPDAGDRPGFAGSWKDIPRVRITGRLDLQGLVAAGGTALPPLALSYCDFDSPIDMAAISLSALTLTGSRFSALRLSEATIVGSVNLDWCGPRANPICGADGETRDRRDHWPFDGRTFKLETVLDQARFVPVGPAERARMLPSDCELAECVLVMSDVRIGGNCNLTCSDFVRRRKHECEFASERHLRKNAVELKGAQILGELVCLRTVIIGSMSLSSAEIGEDVRFMGARIIAYAGLGEFALTLQNARIAGMLVFNTPDAELDISRPELKQRDALVQNIVIGGIQAIGVKAKLVWIGGAILLPQCTTGEPDSFLNGWDASVLDMQIATVETSVKLGSWHPQSPADAMRAWGVVWLPQCEIGKSLEIYQGGSTSAQEPPVTELLSMDDPFVRDFLGYREMTQPRCFALSAEGIRVGQHVEFRSARFVLYGINLRTGTIERGLEIGPRCEIEGGLLVERARIGGRLSVECDVTAAAWGKAIDGPGLTLGGDLRLSPPDQGARKMSVIKGAIDLSGARIETDCHLSRLQLEQQGTSLARPDGVWTGLALTGTEIKGRLLVDELNWKPLPLEATQTQRKQTAAHKSSQYWFKDAEKLLVRTISCYPELWLVDGVKAGEVRRGLWSPALVQQFIPLTETMSVFSMGQLLSLKTEEQRRDYITLFCDIARGEDGTFRLIRTADDRFLQYVQAASDETDPAATPAGSGGGETSAPSGAQLPVPGEEAPKGADFSGLRLDEFRSVPSEDGKWRYQTTLLYGDSLFHAELLLSPDGTIEMVEDKPVATVTSVTDAYRAAERPAEPPEGVVFQQIGQEASAESAAAVETAVRAHLDGLGGADADPDDPVNAPASEPSQSGAGTTSAPVLVDLVMLNCGFLDDNFGSGWGMAPDMFRLLAAGIQCRFVEPSGEAQERHAGSAAGAFNRPQSYGAAKTRSEWLALQFRRRVPNGPREGFRRRALANLKDRTITDREFVPQTWDTFANAYFRAGENGTARDLLIERRDLESFLRAARVYDWLRRSTLGLQRRSLLALTGLLALAFALAIHFGVIPGLQSGDTAFQLALAAAVILLLVLLAPFVALLADWSFRFCFRYGLSPWRATATFVAMLTIGALGAHTARTGSPFSIQTDWASLKSGDDLDPRIALVLNVDYGAERRGAQGTRPDRGLPGEAIYAAPTPCNLGVSSIVYAVDVFIPVLDLGQEERCTIREEEERAAGGRSYFGWRIAMMIYQLLGWIVTSLTILTISGVLRRDLER